MTRYRARPTGRMFNLVDGAAPEWRVRAQAEGGTTEVYLYDEISYWGITAADMVGALAGAGDVELHIHSPGGDVFEGIAILNVLRAHPGDINVVVDGYAASAASFVAMAGKTVTMAQNAQMMIHDALMLTIGNQADHLKSAELLGQASENIASIYAGRAGGTLDEWRARMQDETWYTADGAVAAGLADRVAGTGSAPENTWDLSVFRKSTNKSPGTTTSTAPPVVVPATTARAEDDFEWDVNDIRRAFEEAVA